MIPVSRRRMGRGFGMGGVLGSGQWLEGYILLLLLKSPSYGYDLTRAMGDFNVEFVGIGQMGTLYRILRQMEDKGWVASEWSTVGSGAPRRIYKITDDGRKYLDIYVEHLKSMENRIEDFIGAYEKNSSKK